MDLQKTVTELRTFAKAANEAADVLAGVGGKKKPGRAPLSKDARERIAEAQRKRWAAVRKGRKAA